MRFLQRKTDGSFSLIDYRVENISNFKYAILSHTWLADDDEVNFEDMTKASAQSKPAGYRKIQFCSDQAAKDGLEYFWVDTCCINKSSSAELQEAITSMFNWYLRAAICYVYLTDVSFSEEEAKHQVPPENWKSAFRRSRWFTRGWTLQELIAPASVVFYSAQGIRLGDKSSLEQDIHEITGIPRGVLRGDALDTFSVVDRLLWAEKRQTKRQEDKAYSLLGIFNIFMPLMYGEGDHAMTRLREEIDRKIAKNAKLDHLLSALPLAAPAAFNSFENQHGPTCLEDTRVELLQEITTWADGRDQKSILWLNGIAGTGKSTIARTIARIYHDRGNLGASFLFSRGGGDVSNADKLLTTIAWQIATKIPAARPYICEAIMENKDIAVQSLRDQWDQLILNPLSKLNGNSSPSIIVIVIDALDECDSERDIRIILRLLSMANSLSNIQLRIFITSRPEIPIRCGFQQIPESERQGFVLHDIELNIVNRDLNLFFEHTFLTMREERGFALDWPGGQIVKRLVEISCGLFIWASTACRFIREGRRLAMRRIMILINGHRSGADPLKQLDEIYTMVLKDSISGGYNEKEKRELYSTLREVLGSIVLLFSPLSVRSLANLVGLPSSHVNETLADLHTIFHIPNRKNRPVRLHHPTFREFLLDNNRCNDANFWIDQKQAHKALADSCVDLMSRMLKRDICGLKSPGTLTKDVDHKIIEKCLPPELQYACLYWVQHYRHSGIQLSDGDKAHLFFKKYYLYWLEAINLMGKSSEMSAIIRMYHSLLEPTVNLQQLPFAKDARRFLFTFQSIIEQAPLQTYCAALAFVLPTNELKQTFQTQMHPWIRKVLIANAIAPKVKDEYNYVNDIAFTPDSKLIASGSVNEVVRLWDTATKATSGKLVGQKEKVSSVAISTDGLMIASGSDDASVMVWDMKTRVVRYTCQGHSRWVNSVAFSPDGKLLASGSMDESMRVWDATNGKELQVFDDRLSCVNAISFSPDGELIASGTVDRLVRLWDVAKGEIRIWCDGHSGCINSVKFSPKGDRIISGSDDMTIKVWDTVKGAILMTLKGHSKKVMAVTYSPDARLIASGSEDKTVRLWSASTGSSLALLKGHTSGVNAVTFSPNGQLLASGAFNDEIRLWNAKTGASRGELAEFEDDVSPAPSDGLGLDWNVVESDEKMKELSHEPTSDPHVELTGHSSTVICVAFSPDGQLVASGSHDTTIKLWAREGVECWKLEGHSGSINHLAYSPDSQLVASASKDKTIKLWNTATGAALHTLEGHFDNVLLVLFSSDGRLLVSCSSDKTAILWDTTTGELIWTLEGHYDTVNNIAFSPDDKLIATCSADTTIRLWDVTTGESVKTLEGHLDAVESVAFSSDGRLLVSCSADTNIRLWDPEGTARGIITGHTLPVTSVAFSPDNKLVVSSSVDETVRLWDLETHFTQGSLEIGIVVRTVSFSSDGRYIETDRGVLDVNLFTTPAPPDSVDQSHTLIVTKDWLKRQLENFVWLPREYHASSVATLGKTVVLGHASGSVSFIYL